MAAYAALISLLQTVTPLLDHPDLQSLLNHYERQQIESLHDRVVSLQLFLENSPEKAISFEGRIRDVATAAEDIIQNAVSNQILPSNTDFEHWILCVFQKLCQELQKVMLEIGSLSSDVMEIESIMRKDCPPLTDSFSSTSLSRHAQSVGKVVMVGFEEDLAAVRDRLFGESSKLHVIPIYGMGGIGKTTLARSAYKDPLSVMQFDIHAWVTVSQTYTIEGILSSLLLAMGVSDRTPRIVDVYKRLKGRRYLIVVDDIWSTGAWDDVKMIFPNDDNGSRIILTTRLFDVATYASNSAVYPHEMQLMNDDQSWDLLKEKVFMKEHCPPELESIGRTIARECGGLPLAICLVGGLLSTVSPTGTSWQNIANNVQSVVSTIDENFALEVISLSYAHLPHLFRPCFLYLGIFPQDHEIRVSKLVKLWVAEGFLKPSGNKSPESVAEECLEEVVKRSLVLVSQKTLDGKIKSCKLHHLVWDFCIRKAEEEKFFLLVMHPNVHMAVDETRENELRVSVLLPEEHSLAHIFGSSTRTIAGFMACGLDFIKNLRLLRVLDCPLIYYVDVLPPVFELRWLKYLAIGGMAGVPPSIFNLRQLQTLIIQFCSLTASLPFAIWGMAQLRHVVIKEFSLPDPEGMPYALGNLQTLSEAKNVVITEKFVSMVPSLRKLGIVYGEDGFDGDYLLENLGHLEQLEELKLRVHCSFIFRDRLNPVFPQMLRKLSLLGLKRPWKDIVIVASLSNLEVLKLKDDAFNGDEWETTEGGFHKLKFLLINNCNFQQWLVDDKSHFPRLECLHLLDCRALEDIPEAIGEIDTLELVTVDDRNKSLGESAKRMQEDQQENIGNYVLQVQIVQRIPRKTNL